MIYKIHHFLSRCVNFYIKFRTFLKTSIRFIRMNLVDSKLLIRKIDVAYRLQMLISSWYCPEACNRDDLYNLKWCNQTSFISILCDWMLLKMKIFFFGQIDTIDTVGLEKKRGIDHRISSNHSTDTITLEANEDCLGQIRTHSFV